MAKGWNEWDDGKGVELRQYSTRWSLIGITAGALIFGVIALSIAEYLWMDPGLDFFESRRERREYAFFAAIGAAIGAVVGGLTGAVMDKVSDSAKKQ